VPQPLLPATVTVTIGADVFLARLRQDLAPRWCQRLKELMPYRGDVIHARWSGEAIWSPLSSNWQSQAVFPPESPTGRPRSGDVLLFAGSQSEPELLIAYGPTRFASKSGALEGNVVLTIDDRHARLAELGREILWRGALRLRIE